ncbi:MAG TPA: WD40 repeat domain-containing protein, partial [Anaerolineales bacterium]|nr:WD40 repeat domain-containing protein [Anaerolineales bacterium]
TSNNYIEENGLQFSPDGNWLFLKLPHDLEIWNFKTLLKHHTFNNLEYSDGLFAVSPNSKFIALELEERLSLYEIETMKLIWQTPSVWGTIGEMRFSEDGSQLIFIWGKKLFRLNTTTGEVTQEMEIVFFKDGYNFILNKNGNYFVGYHEGIIYFFDGTTGKQLRSGDHCAEGFLTFLPNDDLLCWSYQSGIYQLYIWDNSGSLKKATDYPVSHWPGMLTYSPDSQMTILSYNSAGTNLLNLFKDTTQELLLDRAVTAAAFSVDNHVLVIATADGYLRFFAQTPVEK